MKKETEKKKRVWGKNLTAKERFEKHSLAGKKGGAARVKRLPKQPKQTYIRCYKYVRDIIRDKAKVKGCTIHQYLQLTFDKKCELAVNQAKGKPRKK